MKPFTIRLSVLFVLRIGVDCAKIASRQINLGGHSYFLPPTKAWYFQSWRPGLIQSEDEFIPLTVTRVDSSNVTEEGLRATFAEYNTTDDVWTPDFTESIFMQSPVNGFSRLLASELQPQYSINYLFCSATNHSSIPDVPTGPYFIQTYTGHVYRAYKLINDASQAFIQSSYQDDDGVHHPLAAASMSAGALTVGIPSRLYYTRTPEKPLAGLRIAVKDIYDLKGLKTSGGNRALYEMGPVKNTTALPVQKLVDAGAVVVGKTHLSEFAFAGGQIPEHVDYILPFNPRGDGYNSPGDSSGGSGSAVASYEWLDMSMGSDTGGSIRGPAINNGVMGNRPSTGAVDLLGVLPLSSAMDTSGVLVRDPMLWSVVNRILYSGFARDFPALPKHIYIYAEQVNQYADATGESEIWWSKAQQFVKRVSRLLQANSTQLSLDDLWNKTSKNLQRLENTPLSEVVAYTYGNLTTYEQWTLFGREYVRTWMEAHDGEFPAMVPNTRDGWLAANASITPDLHQQSLENLAAVRQWVEDEFLRPDEDSCSDAIFLYFTPPDMNLSYKPKVDEDTYNPSIRHLIFTDAITAITAARLNMTLVCVVDRNDSKKNAACQDAKDTLRQLSSHLAGRLAMPHQTHPSKVASIAGLPDFAITLGEMEMAATVSQATMKPQSLPWGVNIMAGRGCDFMLQELVSALALSGIIKPIKAGKHVY
ncbi:glutamyl-tRNA amidotransferase, subunit A [Durotheca rogersii]|uniref:glutamyl-tRNA amidotransferase, subunit A n=1 Tax=Durotheca rogersii TaxID=419775 RepID=UPI0022208136|nr:glutamyl-tRNA amidotransferase, subunit A [Durotheca rogersii]KAI5852048.1 glutamyl-tRNA amidotransferase, subunit A [Durotheca rogersii]